MPARADLFTGRWTYTYMGWEPLPSRENALAEILRRSRYTTMAVVDTPFFLREGYGYDRGFSDFTYIRGQGGGERRDVNMQRRYETDYCAPRTMLTASRWLERHRKEKFFLYVDTWDPHEPWDPPSWYIERYYAGFDGRVAGRYYPDFDPCYWFWEEKGLTEEDLKKAYACYCGEVRMVDRWTGHLLESLEAMNLMDETAIIFTTDHGFYFGEHGQLGKAIISREKEGIKIYRSPIYEEVAHIPLLAYIPGVEAHRVDSLSCIPDLMPTILELAGADIPDTVQARSLSPSIMGKRQKSWDFVVTSWPLYTPGEFTRAVDAFEKLVQEFLPSTITTKEWSLIYSSKGEPAELYHLTSDPKQEKNLIQEAPQVAEDLHEKFLSRLKEAGTKPTTINPRLKL